MIQGTIQGMTPGVKHGIPQGVIYAITQGVVEDDSRLQGSKASFTMIQGMTRSR